MDLLGAGMQPNDHRPEPTKFRLVSFAVHATRGVLRDQNARRKTIFAATLLAVVMLFCGATFLPPMLDPHAHAVWFVFYWFACAWVTMLAALLALFDLLLVRAQGRSARRQLREEFTKRAQSDDDG